VILGILGGLGVWFMKKNQAKQAKEDIEQPETVADLPGAEL